MEVVSFFFNFDYTTRYDRNQRNAPLMNSVFLRQNIYFTGLCPEDSFWFLSDKGLSSLEVETKEKTLLTGSNKL